MLDPQRGIGELASEPIAPPLVAVRPGGIVNDHLKAHVVPFAAFGPGESRPDDRHDRSGQLDPLGPGELVPGQPAPPCDELIQVDDGGPASLGLPQAPPGHVGLSGGFHPGRRQPGIQGRGRYVRGHGTKDGTDAACAPSRTGGESNPAAADR